MKTTSHFIGLDMIPSLLSDIFVNVYEYLEKNNILEAVNIQNPLSPHITLYYLDNKLSDMDKNSIKKFISTVDIYKDIYLDGIDYFFREENKIILYFTTKTRIPLKEHRDVLHKKYNKVNIEENSFDFSPHITFLRILDPEVFESHIVNIENIIINEIGNLRNINISNKKLSLYAVNSTFKEEIQIVL